VIDLLDTIIISSDKIYNTAGKYMYARPQSSLRVCRLLHTCENDTTKKVFTRKRQIGGFEH
jgi:hypothetical protein